MTDNFLPPCARRKGGPRAGCSNPALPCRFPGAEPCLSPARGAPCQAPCWARCWSLLCPELVRSCPARSRDADLSCRDLVRSELGQSLPQVPLPRVSPAQSPCHGVAKILPVSHVVPLEMTFKPPSSAFATAIKIPETACEGEAGFPGKRGFQLSTTQRSFSRLRFALVPAAHSSRSRDGVARCGRAPWVPITVHRAKIAT